MHLISLFMWIKFNLIDWLIDQDETRQARARGLVPDAASGTRRCGAPAPLHAASHRRRCTGRKPVEAPLPPGAALQLGSGRNSRGGGPRTWPWCCFNYEETKIGLAAYRTTIKQYPKPSQIRVLNLFRKICWVFCSPSKLGFWIWFGKFADFSVAHPN